MKYTLIALASLTLWTGTASAGQDIHKWHCADLKANWQHAPQLQCPQAYLEAKLQPQAVYQPPTRIEVVDEIPK